MNTSANLKVRKGRAGASEAAGSLLAALALTGVCAMLLLLVLPALSRGHRHDPALKCASNLKNIGLAHRIFATDNSDQFPYAVYSNQVAAADLTAAIYFGLLSNELSTPRILICRADESRGAANSWTDLHSTNISYFAGLNADEARPESILGGERNLTMSGMPIQAGVARATNMGRLAWGGHLHGGRSSIVRADGSVQLLASKRLDALRTNFFHKGEWRLVMP